MRVPLSWLREYAPLPEPVDATEVARRLTAAGLEVESLESVGHDIRGVVVAQVLSIEELTGPLNLKKPIRYCRVAVSESQLAGPPEEASGVICGAVNFAVGDRVALALPGAVLPGGFEIGARKTYGHISEGMICSVSELGIGDDHSGILVLPPDAPLGADFVSYANLRDEVFEIAVTPDRGYAVSVRGIARELASAFGVPFRDPAETALPDATLLGSELDYVGPDVYPARIDDPTGCDRFVLREVRGFLPSALTPLWMRVRLARSGVRSVSLAVDVTNYLMLELGQPLHAFDRSKLTGEIVVRRAQPGEKLETLDHVVRTLDADDVLITDASGPISLAGTMGGLSTEIDETSTDLVIEAAHFSAEAIAKMARRHKLHSEASYRFERGVDRELPLRATAKAVALLSGLGGGQVVPGCTHASVDVPPVLIWLAADYPDRVAGVVYGRDTVVRRLREVGASVRETRKPAPTVAPWRADPQEPATAPLVPVLEVTPPTWRPDLTDPADLAEEVIRLEGYEMRPGPDAPRAGRPRAHPAPAAAPFGGPDAGRGRVRGGDVVALRVARRRGPARAADRRHAPPRGRGGEPAQRGRTAAPHDPDARTVPGPGPEHGAGVRRHGAVRDRPGLPAPAGSGGLGADPPGGPRALGGRTRLPGSGPARPAAAGRRGADWRACA